MRPLLAALLVIGSAAPIAANAPSAVGPLAATLPDAAEPADTGWQVRADDNIVGLSDPKTLSNPAVVDYDALMKATPEMKRMRKDRIDPHSPEGIQLTTAAQQRVQRGCQAVMDAGGYCSVWKAIAHEDGRQVPDVTADVKRQI